AHLPGSNLPQRHPAQIVSGSNHPPIRRTGYGHHKRLGPGQHGARLCCSHITQKKHALDPMHSSKRERPPIGREGGRQSTQQGILPCKDCMPVATDAPELRSAEVAARSKELSVRRERRGENAPLAPCRVARSWPLTTSQSRTVPSQLPEANVRPSG